LRKHVRLAGKTLVLTNVAQHLKKVFVWNGMDDLLVSEH